MNSKEKINSIIDRSLTRSLEMPFLEDIMDWNRLEDSLAKLDFEIAPDQPAFVLSDRLVTTRLGWVSSEDEVFDYFEKNRADIKKNIGDSKKITYYIRSFSRSYPRIGDSIRLKQMCPVVVEYTVDID